METNNPIQEASYVMSERIKAYLQTGTERTKKTEQLLATPIAEMSDEQLYSLIGFIVHSTDAPEKFIDDAAIIDAAEAMFETAETYTIDAARLLTIIGCMVDAAAKKAAKKAVKKVIAPAVLSINNLEYAMNARMDRLEVMIDEDDLEDELEDELRHGTSWGAVDPDIDGAIEFIDTLEPQNLDLDIDEIRKRYLEFIQDEYFENMPDEDTVDNIVKFISMLTPEDLEREDEELEAMLQDILYGDDEDDEDDDCDCDPGIQLTSLVGFIKTVPAEVLAESSEKQIIDMYLTALAAHAEKTRQK